MLTVCIVEDQDPIRERIASRLRAMPLVSVVGELASGTAALDQLERLAPALTIMDIGLPGMSGTEVIARLLERGFAGDFIVFTVFDHDEHLFRALELGARGYILKGDGATGVQQGIEEYRRGGAPMSRVIAKRVLEAFAKPRPTGVAAKIEALTEQQNTILALVAQGLLNKEIGDRLGITEDTVKQHNVRIYRRLSVANRVEAIRLYLDTPSPK